MVSYLTQTQEIKQDKEKIKSNSYEAYLQKRLRCFYRKRQT